MADILPECLIQKILSFLCFYEAAQMGVVSKTWLQAWLTLSTLKFYQGCNRKIVDNIMERYRKGKIPIEKLELLEYYPDSYKNFPLTVNKWLDIAFQNGVKHLVFRIPKFSLPIFSILAEKSLRELVLSSCDLKRASLSSDVVNCPSLRKLSLISVYLDESMLQTLLNSCRLIVSFIFKYCDGLKKIELLNLPKIKSVSISKDSYQGINIQAATLEHLSYSGYSSGKLDVIECQNLESLDLSHMIESDGFLHNLISRSQSMKVLKVWHCECIREIESPNLVTLEYTGRHIPKLKIARESSQLKHSKIILYCDDNLDVVWFGELRNFLSNLTSWSQVSLYFSKCSEIKMKDLQLHHIGPTTLVDVLNVNILNEECPTLLDALLWICHPRRLNLY